MKERWRLVLLATVSLLVYANTLRNSFVFDDEEYIFRNRPVTALSVTGLLRPDKFNNVYRPVSMATFAFNWAVGHAHPWGYHLFNILLHMAVTLLLYLVLRKLLERLPEAGMIAFAAALLFAVHPIHTEAVAWITGRSELLAAGFLLLGWLFHIEDQPLPALLCFLLALLSKESAVVLVPLLVLGDYARGKLKPPKQYLGIAGLAVLFFALFWKLKGGRFGQKAFNPLDNPLASLPLHWRILNAIRIAWKYLGLHVYPAKLSCDYSYNAITLYANWRNTLPALVGLLVVLALWIWTIRTRRSGWLMAVSLYLAGFSVTANILIPTGTIMGERLAYLPSAGFCLLVALIWIQVERRNRIVAWTVLAGILAALGARTVIRNRDWRDNSTLFLADVRAVPGSTKMHANAGGVYYRQGQLQMAHSELQTALRIFPEFPEAIELLGLTEASLGNDQEALRLLQKALSMSPPDSIDHDFRRVNLAEQLMKLSRFDDALRLLNRIIEESPDPGFASQACADRATIRLENGDSDAARSDLQLALRMDPHNARAQSLVNALKPTATSMPLN
jgi:tetratricopeptide (TPR) repeat protein